MAVVTDLDEFVPIPRAGRSVTRVRRVRLGDVTVSGRLRLDALARYLQDVASDDVDDAGILGAWVLRRVVLALGDLPHLRDEVTLTTFCSGVGSRFAERRTTVATNAGVAAEAVALWVYVDADGRPARLEPWFFDRYGEAAAGRQVSSRLRHPRPSAGADRRPWPLRVTDVDVLDHVNNAVAWAAVEEEIDSHARGRRICRAEVEYRAAIDLGDEVELRAAPNTEALACWLTVGDEVKTSAIVTLA
jgi:acyl-ACP thioesterase